MEPANVDLPVWKPEFQRGKNFSMLILASRGSGKSYLCKYLIEYHLRDKYDLFVVISASEDELENYREILPGRLTFDYFDPDLLTKLIEINSERQRLGKPIFQILIIFDDQISNKMKYNDELLQLFTRGRHVGISIIFISQSHVFASTAWRNNSDKIIVLKQNVPQAKEAVTKNILSGSVEIPDEMNSSKEKKFYMNLMKKYANKEGDALVLDYHLGSFDNLYQYRAPEIKVERIEEKPLNLKPPEAEEVQKVEEEIVGGGGEESDSYSPLPSSSSEEESDDSLDFGINF